MSARDIAGWNSDITPWAEQYAKRIPPGGTYLEVGVFLGASLATMGELRPDITLIAVDPWLTPASRGYAGPGILAPDVEREGGGDLFLAFLGLMRKHAPDTLRRTCIIRGTAETVSLHVPVDLLFIDGAHDEASVRADLHAFAPLVRYGSGIIAGHDYAPDWPGVVTAVDDYFGHRPNTMRSVWWVDA
jgi:hypothetical protein